MIKGTCTHNYDAYGSQIVTTSMSGMYICLCGMLHHLKMAEIDISQITGLGGS